MKGNRNDRKQEAKITATGGTEVRDSLRNLHPQVH
jgi:hypothetical protein